MDGSIFRAYDIRGVYPNELNEQDAYQIAHAVFEYLKSPKVVAVGRDARLAAPSVHGAICQAFQELGAEVLDLGMVSTDMTTFAAGRGMCDVAINVTASHNPAEWIGMKITVKGGDSVGGDGEIQEIRSLVEKKYSQKKYVAQTNNFKKLDILSDWIEHVLNQIDRNVIKGLKIVVDAGNGVAGPIVRELAQSLSLDVDEMYFDPDGSFPNHLPSPIEPKNVEDLRRRVVEIGADLGMAFDGDADRVFLVDEKGVIVSGSEMTAMVMDALLDEDANRVMLYNAICGWNVQDVIKKHNATGHRTMVGHGYIKKDMKKYQADFAGEHSGHYFFRNNFNADSGLIAAVLVLELMSKTDKELSQLLAEHRKYPAIPETNFRVNDVNAVLKRLEEKFGRYGIDRLDGLTVRADDWWFNVRPSSNEPLLRLNLEAKNEEILKEMQKQLTSFIEEMALMR